MRVMLANTVFEWMRCIFSACTAQAHPCNAMHFAHLHYLVGARTSPTIRSLSPDVVAT